MKTTPFFKRQQYARDRNPGLASPLAFVLCATVLASNPVFAVHDAAGFNNIEMEGNTVNDAGAVEGIHDWDDVFNKIYNSTPFPVVDPLRWTFNYDTTVNDPTAFDGGIKDILPIADWTCNTTNVQNKSDIQHSYGATYDEAGDVVIYIGVDRDDNNGSANFGVWLLQQPASCSSAGGSTPFVGAHVDGDILLVAEFDQGGSVSTISAYRWSHGPDMIAETADDCLGADGGVNDDDADPDNCSAEGEPFATGLNCANEGPGDVICGITNDTLDIDSIWRAGIPTNAFYEVGANLTDLIPEATGCFATALVETRSSTSLTATLKDFTILDLATCGTLTVEKVTVGGSGEFDFTVSPDPGEPGSPISLTGGESQLFATVEPDTYTITENGLPMGPAAPNGWNLTDISCTPTQNSDGLTDGGHGGGFAEVDIAANSDVTCTFTNTFTPPPGTITIEKVCDSVDNGGQTFDFTLVGFGGSTTPACADGSETLSCGGSITCEGLVAGGYTVDETVPSGWQKINVSCVGGTSSTCGSAETPDATITLGAGQSATATFTNQELATIEICKATDPAATGGDFTFTGPGGEFLLADGECEGPTEYVSGLQWDFTETEDPDFTLSSINCTGSNWSATSPTVSVTPDPGEAVSCTFTNTENPGYIQICKTTVGVSNPSFTVRLNGPDSDLEQSTTLQNGECAFGSADSDAIVLTAGTGYAATEDAAAGWDTTVTCIGSEGEEPADDIDLSPNEEVVCTFTNTERGSITVEKQTLPDGSAQSFTFTGDLAGSIADGGTISTDVPPGNYSSTETVPAGWDLTSIVCDDDDSTGDTDTGVASFVVAAGEDVTCVFTNTQDGRIEIEKQTLPDGSAQSFTFAGDVAGSLSDGQSAGADVAPGSFSSTETVPAGWVLTSIVCDDDNSTGDTGTGVASFEVAPGETVRCVFTNTQDGRIEIEKQTLPDGSAQSFTFAGDVAGSLSDGQSAGADVAPGSYSSTETVPAGWTLTDITCDDGDSTGDTGTGIASFEVGPGETVRCVFTNTQDGRIEIEKQTLPDGSAQSFTFTGDVAGSLTDGGTAGADVFPGSYSSTESLPGGWELTDITCDDGDSTGDTGTGIASFEVGPGETVRCVFTNVQNASVTIVKQAAGPDDEFCFSVDQPGGSGLTCIITTDGTGSIPHTGLAVASQGLWQIAEVGPEAPWVLFNASCDNGDDPSSVDVGPGDNITCTFMNTIPVPVPVNNAWALLLMILSLMAMGWYFRPAVLRRN